VLADEARVDLARYAVDHAADRSPQEGSKRLLDNLADSSTPMRVTALPMFGTKHSIARKFVAGSSRKGLTDCRDCHMRASEGSFGLKELRIPGR
jgi:hypothetical protein